MVLLRRRVVALIAFGVLLLSATAVAGQLRVISIDIEGATQTYVYGINPSGDMVGGCVVAGKLSGFVLRNGVVETVDVPGAARTECYGINPQGDVVGQYFLAANKTTHGFILPAGSSEPLPFDVEQPADMGNANTMPFKIAPDGTIIGCLHESNPNGGAYLSTMHGFVIDANGVSTDPLGGSMHTGINPSGAVAGHYYSSAITLESYILKNGNLTWFTYPGYAITRAYDINANGDVVGFCRANNKSPFHGFLYQHGSIDLIDVPDAVNTVASGINPQGDIVGYYQDATGYHGFLMTRRGDD